MAFSFKIQCFMLSIVLLLVGFSCPSVFGATAAEGVEAEEAVAVQEGMWSSTNRVSLISLDVFESTNFKLRNPRTDKMEESGMTKQQIDILVKEANSRPHALKNLQSYSALVMFYTDWCGHCHDFAKVYEEAADAIHDIYEESPGGRLHRVSLVAINVTDESAETREQYGIKYFPTLQWWRGGFYSGEYTGLLPVENHASLVDWVIGRVSEPVEITVPVDIDNFLAETSVMGKTGVIGFLDDPSVDFGRGFAFRSFRRFFVDVDGIRVAAAIGSGSGILARKHGGTERPPTVLVFRDNEEEFLGEKRVMQYTGGFLDNYLTPWLRNVTMPRLPPWNAEYQSKLLLGSDPGYDLLGLVFTEGKMSKALANALVEVDKDMTQADHDGQDTVERHFRFVRAEHCLEHHADLLEFYNVPSSHLPALVFINVTDVESRRWRYPSRLDKVTVSLLSDVKSFTLEILNGNIVPEERGSTSPPLQVEGRPVREVVRSTWDDVVTFSDGDVFAVLYAGVGEQSKVMLENFRLLADLFTTGGVEGVTFVSCDVIVNKIDGLGDLPYTPLLVHMAPLSEEDRKERKKPEMSDEEVGEGESRVSVFKEQISVSNIYRFMHQHATVAKIPTSMQEYRDSYKDTGKGTGGGGREEAEEEECNHGIGEMFVGQGSAGHAEL